MSGVADTWEISVLSAQFCWEPQTALKIKSIKFTRDSTAYVN